VNADQLVELGDSLLMVRRTEEALDAYDEAIKFDEGHYEAWQHKAEAFKILEKFEEALLCYERAIAIDSSSVIAKSQKEHFLRKLGRT